jgi:uncharacterized membrane protein
MEELETLPVLHPNSFKLTFLIYFEQLFSIIFFINKVTKKSPEIINFE